MNFKSDLYNSLMNNALGFSGRKLSAFIAITVAAFLSLRHTTDETLTSVITIWLIFCAVALGMVTAEQLVKFKNGSSTTTTNESELGKQTETVKIENPTEEKL